MSIEIDVFELRITYQEFMCDKIDFVQLSVVLGWKNALSRNNSSVSNISASVVLVLNTC